MSGMDGETAGREALKLIEAALSQRPHKQDKTLSDATQRLCLYRDALIAEAKDGKPESRQRLTHLNAILSVVAGAHFPLGSIPWDELQKARDWLKDLVERKPAKAQA